jgi:hypothetical protein
MLVQTVQTGVDTLAGILALIPNFKVGVPTSIGATFGGDNVSQGLKAFSSFLGGMNGLLHSAAGLASTMGSYQRRYDDWKLQERATFKELEQIDKNILAAEIRLAVANQELSNQDLQIENSKELDELMHSKFSNHDLYDWMVTQISGVYFQAYQLAYDMARRAEQSFRFELAAGATSFIQFGYWDSLKKGLLAGERLHHDLKRMDAAYMDLNQREHELTRHISLQSLNPLALLAIKVAGQAVFTLDESLFDMDHPGHYLRRIKSVSLTIPCVAGPYTSINATLTLLANTVRKNTSLAGGYTRTGLDDPRFTDAYGAIQSIATSTAQNDSGLFEVNFRDERYLPFEYAGAISQWRLELPRQTNAFDFNTLQDVVLHVKYTSRNGGGRLDSPGTFRGAAHAAATALVRDASKAPLARFFSLRHEFPNEFYRLLT